MTSNKSTDDKKIQNLGTEASVKKKKKRRRTIDKAKVEENKKKAKARKERLRQQMKEEKARSRAEKQKKRMQKETVMVEETVAVREGDALEQTVMMEEIVTVREDDALEQAVMVEETLTVKETAGQIKEQKNKKENVKKEKVKKDKEQKDKEQKDKEQKDKIQKETRQKPQGSRRRAVLAAGIAAVIVLLAGSGSFLGIRYYLEQLETADAAVEAMVHTEAVELAEYSMLQHKKEHVKKNAGKDVPKAFLDAARFVLEGVKNRPPEIELTEENAADFATIESCVINTQTGKVDVTMSAEGLAVSDDGYYYLFEEKVYESALTGEEYIIEDQKDVELTFSVNLNYNSAGSRLFSKFVVAVKKDGKFMAISRPRHITNPEAIARYSPAFGDTSSKKGLLVDPEKLRGSDLDDLGVKHAAYNIPLRRLLGNTTHASYPTVYYTYNGRNYAFNGQVVAEYDYIFSTLSGKGIIITAIILNDMNPGHMDLIHPRARSGGAGSPYFAFNAADEAGTEYIAAVASFLANRYAGTGHGKVMNWVIGNEINARKEWNYIEPMDTVS